MKPTVILIKRLFYIYIVSLLFVQPLAASESVKPYPLTPNDKILLGNIENYLSSIHTISAEFLQASPNGDMASGKFYLERPGKLRLEYAPPTPVLMVTDGSTIIYYDKELDQISRIPMDSTLVGFLAQERVKFDKAVIVTGFENVDGILRVSLVQQDRPKDGTLTLEFSDRPLMLHNMIVTDNSGQKTAVGLNKTRFNVTLDNALFVFKDPHLSKKPAIQN